MIREVKREKFPMKANITDSNWNPGIMIGNTIIFNGFYKKEVKQIKNIYQKDNYTHAFFVEYKDDPVLKAIYIRE